MTRLIASIYEQPRTATEVMDQLRDAGFEPSQIECVEASSESRNFFVRGPRTDSRAQVMAPRQLKRLLVQRGMPDDQIDEQLQWVRGGHSLVVLHSSDELSGRGAQIMNAEREMAQRALTTYESRDDVDRREVDEDSDHRSGPTDTAIIETSQEKTTHDGERRRPKKRRKKKKRESSPIQELSTTRARERFEIYKPDFRRHFEQHYAALGHHSFDSFARAYRFGVALAIDRAHRRHNWPAVEQKAQQQWRSATDLDWSEFREAVRFGWYRVRGEEEKYSGRPRRL